ncbi:hypothetical protein P9B03_01590 [Metasolibacillus meyeri]|uniref:Uncharacterized protein n=1 Tax=Metasolibacillus meyeri TaxID=1071052 RepID=A0AAW9NN38_9BACL|nr:hypothetical protein [Metasolibacillus meyeri]MEC1177164.1 hypothetical protein [Metasolibacillus meyeri]
MKKVILSFLIVLFSSVSIGFTSTVSASGNNEAETIIEQHIHYLKSNK